MAFNVLVVKAWKSCILFQSVRGYKVYLECDACVMLYTPVEKGSEERSELSELRNLNIQGARPVPDTEATRPEAGGGGEPGPAP